MVALTDLGDSLSLVVLYPRQPDLFYIEPSKILENVSNGTKYNNSKSIVKLSA